MRIPYCYSDLLSMASGAGRSFEPARRLRVHTHFPPGACEKWGHSLRKGSYYLMVKVSAFDFPPPGAGFLTSIAALPGDATAASGT